jgi:hypothetical protein
MSIFDFFKRKKYNEYDNESFLEQEIDLITSGSDTIEEESSGTDLEFIDASGLLYANLPIQLAKDVPVSSKNAVESTNKKFTFPLCPGMFDYSQVGYIMPAWVDFHIIANKAGVRAYAGGVNKNKRGAHFKDPAFMGPDIVEGLFKLQDDIPLQPLNFNSPWKIFSKKKSISALMLPAFYHTSAEILENLYIYPGIVDYDKFHTANVICAVKRKCNFVIKAGEPLLHIIPFINSDITCGYGPATEEQKSQIDYDPKIYQNQYYRKHHQIKKNYELEESFNGDVQKEEKIESIPGTEIINPGTEIINPGTEIINPGTEIINPGTEIINPGTLIRQKPKKKRNR